MGNRIRRWALVLLVGVAWVSAACVSVGLPDGADYRHRYVAALADYNQAKRAAVVFVGLPDTTQSEADAVVSAVQKADARVREFETLRRSGVAVEADYASVAAVLEIVANELRSRVGE